MTTLPSIQAPTPKISEPLHIDYQNFVPSLLDEGVRTGMLTEEEADAVRAGILNILAENILAVSRGQSTSVKEETAKNLLDNILFHIESALLAEHTPILALSCLKENNICQIYKRGSAMAHKALDEACELWGKLNKVLRCDMDVGYKQLIIGSLSSYLQNYDHKYEPKVDLSICLPNLGIDLTCTGIHQVLSAMHALSELYS